MPHAISHVQLGIDPGLSQQVRTPDFRAHQEISSSRDQQRGWNSRQHRRETPGNTSGSSMRAPLKYGRTAKLSGCAGTAPPLSIGAIYAETGLMYLRGVRYPRIGPDGDFAVAPWVSSTSIRIRLTSLSWRQVMGVPRWPSHWRSSNLVDRSDCRYDQQWDAVELPPERRTSRIASGPPEWSV
jgi:hypothetical protein